MEGQNLNYKVFTLSPGSTSTKIAVFEGERCLLRENVQHEAEKLRSFRSVSDQKPYRLDMIRRLLDESGISLTDMDAFAAYSGGLVSTPGGIFPIVGSRGRFCCPIFINGTRVEQGTVPCSIRYVHPAAHVSNG